MRKIVLAAVVALSVASVIGCCGGGNCTKPTPEKKPADKPASGCSGGGCGSKAPTTIPPAKD